MNEQQIQQTVNVYKENENLIVVKFISNVETIDDNVKQAEFIQSKFTEILNESRKYTCLVDLSKIKTGAHFPSPVAKKIYLEILQKPDIVKFAFVAPNRLLRSVLRYLLRGSSGNTEVEAFDTANAARDWLLKT